MRILSGCGVSSFPFNSVAHTTRILPEYFSATAEIILETKNAVEFCAGA